MTYRFAMTYVMGHCVGNPNYILLVNYGSYFFYGLLDGGIIDFSMTGCSYRIADDVECRAGGRRRNSGLENTHPYYRWRSLMFSSRKELYQSSVSNYLLIIARSHVYKK